MSPTSPSSVRPPSSTSANSRVSAPRAGFEAKAMTRWPRAASLSIAARHAEASNVSSPLAERWRRAQFEHALGRALDGDEAVRADGVERRHESISGIEGDLLEPRGLALRSLGVQAGLDREGDERALHRVAVDDPIGARLSQRSVVAKERRRGRLRQDRDKRRGRSQRRRGEIRRAARNRFRWSRRHPMRSERRRPSSGSR